MPYKEKEITKLYYSIGELADMFDVSTSLIRFWESEFDMLKPKKNKSGNRRYTEADIKKFKQIHYLVKDRGYTLEGAKQHLRDEKSGSVDKVELIESLKSVRGFLQELRKNL